MPLLQILPLGFKHVLSGKILSVNRKVFCTTTSFVAIVILAIIMGDKFNIIVTWTYQQNRSGEIDLLSIQYKNLF